MPVIINLVCAVVWFGLGAWVSQSCDLSSQMHQIYINKLQSNNQCESWICLRRYLQIAQIGFIWISILNQQRNHRKVKKKVYIINLSVKFDDLKKEHGDISSTNTKFTWSQIILDPTLNSTNSTITLLQAKYCMCDRIYLFHSHIHTDTVVVPALQRLFLCIMETNYNHNHYLPNSNPKLPLHKTKSSL